MANELNTAQPTSGLSITAQLFKTGITVGSPITCSEVSTSRFYSGNMPAITAGTYQVVFYDTGITPLSSGIVAWNGSAEILINDLSTATTAGIADAVWDEATTDHTASGTYGGRVVRATNANNELQINAQNHAAANVHQFQTAAITASAFDASVLTAFAVPELQEIHAIHGLKSGSALTVTPSSRAAGAISQSITGDGTTTTTVTRT
ncbi:MAG: hypothetical protein ACOYNL_10940 [Rickettsiales bacterium]